MPTIFEGTKGTQFNTNSVSLHEIFLREVRHAEPIDAKKGDTKPCSS